MNAELKVKQNYCSIQEALDDIDCLAADINTIEIASHLNCVDSWARQWRIATHRAVASIRKMIEED